MDHRLIEGLMVAIAPVIREHLQVGVEKATGPLLDTIRGLESRLGRAEELKAVPGEKGDQGEKGEAGEKGNQGAPGEKGDRGEPGQPGDPGSPGEKGLDGRDGIDGKDGGLGINGKDGMPGERGADGVEGKAGEPGLHGKDGRDGIDGKDANPVEIAALLVPEVKRAVLDEVQAAVAAQPKALNGKDADPVEIAALLVPEVERAVAAQPKAQDGKDADPAVIERMVEKAINARPPARDGKDADPVEVAAILIPKVEQLTAPDDLADDMQKAIWMLAESPPIVRSEKPAMIPQFSIAAPAARSFRFERDEQNRIVAAHAEDDGQ